ncbi:MAG: hypothetical protein M1840_006927 [Geoglossum simile]|nr:MAG: hypothetical protein M1840_006927 [Geoglossum simile]
MGKFQPQLLMDMDISESEREDDESDEDITYTKEYRDPLRGGKRSTNLVVADSQYVSNWKARHGWREFYQNWRDAIKESNELGNKMFAIKYEHGRKHLLFIATHPDTETELGFIRFTKKSGMVELTNYSASLGGKTLGIGSTSKAGKDHLAGHHGEGYKIAALVLHREGYVVKIHASGCNWTFFEALEGKKHAGELCVRIVPRSEKALQQLKDKYATKAAKGKRPRRGNIWEDVTFKIVCRKEAPPVTEKEFRTWVRLALDLDPPSEVLKTQRGSLILDPKFSNKIFLKGILLDGNRFTSTQFEFGYNLFQGGVDRDRKGLAKFGEQKQLLAEIWAEAVEKDANLLTKYVNMLRSHPPPADVSETKDFISLPTASKIWRHLLDKDPERKVFYYDSKRGDQSEKGSGTVTIVWIPLKRYNLVRTPQDQQIHLFQKAPEAPEYSTVYSVGLKRALGAVLALDTRTQDLGIVFKSVGKVQLELLLSGMRLVINETWLSFQESHEKAPCWLSRQAQVDGSSMSRFFCDHIVTDLYKLVLEEIRRRPGLSQPSDSFLYQRVCESLRQMPMMVEASPGRLSGEVDVSWTCLEGDLISRVCRLDPTCRVTLHRESTCSKRRDDLLAPTHLDASPSQTDRATQDRQITVSTCGCPEQVVSQMAWNATFTGLSHEEEYFPMISRNEPQAFFGMAPVAVRPTGTTHIQASLAIKYTPSIRQHDIQDGFNEGYEDLYNTPSNSDSDFIDVDMLHASPSTRAPAARTRRKPSKRNASVRSRTLVSTNPSQFQPVGEIVERLYGDVHALKDEVSRLIENEPLKAQLEDEARDNAKTNKEQLAAKEFELQAARAEMQEQRRSADHTRAALRNKEAEIEELKKANKTLEEADRNAKAEIKAQRILTHNLKKENENLLSEAQLADATWDKLAREAAEQVSKRSKRAREEATPMAAKRSRSVIMAVEEGKGEGGTGGVPPPI